MLTNPLFSNVERIQNAARNAPPMRRGERDKDAVRILQHILLAAGVSTFRRSIKDGALDGDYGGETEEAVKRLQGIASRCGSHCDVDGRAGGQVWTALDLMVGTFFPVPDFSATLATPPAETRTTAAAAPNPTGRPESFSLPSSNSMMAAYEWIKQEWPDGLVCNKSRNCCAVRMSVALARTIPGFTISRLSTEGTRAHQPGSCGKVQFEHVNGSAHLATQIRKIARPQVYRLSSAERRRTALDRMKGTKGIAFFKECFTRTDGSTGNHIDYWDGKVIMNDWMRFNRPEEAAGTGRTQSDAWVLSKTQHSIWFWPLAPGPNFDFVGEAVLSGTGIALDWIERATN